MRSPHKYVYFVLTTPQLELSLAVLRSHVMRVKAQRQELDGAEAAKALETVINKSRQLFDLMLQSLALRRPRTKIIVTENQFNVICQAISHARQRVEARLGQDDKSNEAKQVLLDQLKDLETALSKANHEPTRFDISGADAFKNTELGIRVGPLTHARLP